MCILVVSLTVFLLCYRKKPALSSGVKRLQEQGDLTIRKRNGKPSGSVNKKQVVSYQRGVLINYSIHLYEPSKRIERLYIHTRYNK